MRENIRLNENKTILTVTLNPAIDRFVEIPGFFVGSDNRVCAGQSFSGGKGVNVARALKAMGIGSVIAGFAGGANGQNFLRDLLVEGLAHNFVFIQGETRTNLTVRDLKTGNVTRVIEAGPKIDNKDLRSFRDKFRRLASLSGWIVLSGRGIAGSPEGFYEELAVTGRRQGGRVIVDTSGKDLVFALKGKPFLVKINREEAQTLLKKKFANDKDLRSGLKKILELGAESVIITLGQKGAAGTDGKVFYKAVCPELVPDFAGKTASRRLLQDKILKIKGGSKSVHADRQRADDCGVSSDMFLCSQGVYRKVGCGDAVSAGFIFGYRMADDFVEALAAGVAAGTASYLSAVPGDLKRAEFKHLLTKIKLCVL